MAIKTHKVTLSLDNPRVIQSGINVQSFDKQSIQISIELTKNDEVFQVPSYATIRISLLKLARQEQKIIVDVPNTNRDSIDWIVPDYLDGYQGTVRVGVYLVSGAENVDLGYFTILSNVSDIDKMADEFTDNVFQGWEQIEADLNELNLTIAQTKLDLAEDLTQIDNTIANINTLANDFTTDVATKQADVTGKYNAFDTSVAQANQTIDDILALQPQFQAVLDETTGKDVISAPELIAARNGELNLKTRLDKEKQEVTAQLAQKANELDVRKKAVKLELEDMSEETLSAITGGATVDMLSIPQKESVGINKLPSYMRNTLKIDNFNVNDILKWELGSIASNGTLATTNTRIRMKEYTFVPKGATIQHLDASNYPINIFMFSVSSGSFVTSTGFKIDPSYIYEADDNYLVKIVIRKSGDVAFVESDIPLAISSLATDETFIAYGEGGVLEDKSIVTVKKANFLSYSENTSNVNLFDKTAITSGGYYDPNTLAWVSNSTHSQSAFINCQPLDEITIPSFGTYASYAVFKDADGVIFKGLTIDTDVENPRIFIVPAGAKQFSINIRNSVVDTCMIIKNREYPSEFIPFSYVGIKDERLNQYILDNVKGKLFSDKRYNTANFLGDSITWGYSPYDGTQLPIKFADLVQKKLGIDTVNNYGKSGSTLSDYSGDGVTRQPMCIRYADMDNNADLVFVLGGTNDWAMGVSVGTIDDTQMTTFYGALNVLVDGLLTKYPTQTIVLATPMHRYEDNVTRDLINYRNAILNIGVKYGIPVLDLYATSGFYPDNPANYEAICPDGRHPNEAGHQKLANRISGFLKTL